MSLTPHLILTNLSLDHSKYIMNRNIQVNQYLVLKFYCLDIFSHHFSKAEHKKKETIKLKINKYILLIIALRVFSK